MKKITCFFILTVLATASFAQKLDVERGDIKNLKGISEYQLEFDYSNIQIPKYESEEDFLKDKMDKRDEKEEGTGEKFRESWFADRENRYEPKFINHSTKDLRMEKSLLERKKQMQNM